MKKLILILIFNLFGNYSFAQSIPIDSISVRLVDAQLNAYNLRNIEAFLKPYSDSIKVSLYPNQQLYAGKKIMRSSYSDMFERYPDLHCKLKNRMILKDVIIDHESVTLKKGEPPFEAIAIYQIRNGLIAEVTFVYPETKE